MTEAESRGCGWLPVMHTHEQYRELLRHLDLDDGEGADRLLGRVASVDEWLALGSSLKAVQNATLKDAPGEQQDRCTRAQAGLRDLLMAANGERVALTEWIFASAELALELMRERQPDQTSRLGFYASRARASFEAEEPGAPSVERSWARVSSRCGIWAPAHLWTV